MKAYGNVALRAVADSLDSLVDMGGYFAVLDDSMLAEGQEIYHLMFDNTDDLLLASIDENKTNTLKSAIYGIAVGDALGVPYEFKFRGAFECTDMIGYGTHNQPEGTWSDDTSMALATCASIKACGRVNVDDIRDRFRRWLKEEAYSCKWCAACRGNNGTYRKVQSYRQLLE